MALIRRHTNSAASDLDLHCLPITKVPNLDANSGDPDQTRRSDLSLHHLQMSAKCLWTELFLNLGGVSFVLFDVSLQNKILHCKWTVQNKILHCKWIRVYTVCQSPKKCLWTDPLDKIIWKLRGVKFVLFVVSLQQFLYFGKQC